jgi:hypothetical protein
LTAQGHVRHRDVYCYTTYRAAKQRLAGRPGCLLGRHLLQSPQDAVKHVKSRDELVEDAAKLGIRRTNARLLERVQIGDHIIDGPLKRHGPVDVRLGRSLLPRGADIGHQQHGLKGEQDQNEQQMPSACRLVSLGRLLEQCVNQVAGRRLLGPARISASLVRVAIG